MHLVFQSMVAVAIALVDGLDFGHGASAIQNKETKTLTGCVEKELDDSGVKQGVSAPIYGFETRRNLHYTEFQPEMIIHSIFLRATRQFQSHGKKSVAGK